MNTDVMAAKRHKNGQKIAGKGQSRVNGDYADCPGNRNFRSAEESGVEMFATADMAVGWSAW
jgi:hypothetical protein